MKIRVRSIDYHFEVHQQNTLLPYLVLMHGFLGSGKSFSHLIEPLKKFCNPVTIDLLGHGETEGSEMHYRFAAKEQVADAIKLISEQLNYPLFLHGYSMGGRLALQLALQRPDLFQGVILESTTFGIENEQERQARQVLDGQRADSILGNFEMFLNEWSKMPLFQSETTSPDTFKIHCNQNPVWMSNSLLGFGTGNMIPLKNQLNELSMPVLLIAGERDQKFSNIMKAMYNRVPNSELNIISGSNHRVHIDSPSSFLLSIQKFITSNTLP